MIFSAAYGMLDENRFEGVMELIVKEYIKNFERLGFGMFVHFGLYSLLETGEWSQFCHNIPEAEYQTLAKRFDPRPDWAQGLVRAAKNAGCKYITLTTRHHDGFSLFDTCGLNTYDAPHAKCGRDLVREFVDACRAEGIVPFFYHTLLDWHMPSYQNDFPAYLQYLRASVELLCKNYGPIGGIWFDGMWDKPEADWEEDALYSLIRKYQPEAMIINNTGLGAHGALGHIELDSVTFERGKPEPLNLADSPKYVASEMCEVLGDHWAYAREDLHYKSPAQIIESLADCRRYGANLLLNVGPKADGSLRNIDAAYLELLGHWVRCFDEAIRAPRPSGIAVNNKPKDFILENGDTYYLFCYDLPMVADPNVAKAAASDTAYADCFELDRPIRSISWMDNGAALHFEQKGGRVTVHTEPYRYGQNLVVRIARIVCGR